MTDVCQQCGVDADNLEYGNNPYSFCPAGKLLCKYLFSHTVTAGVSNGFDVKIGEIGPFNPAGLDNCGKLLEHIR